MGSDLFLLLQLYLNPENPTRNLGSWKRVVDHGGIALALELVVSLLPGGRVRSSGTITCRVSLPKKKNTLILVIGIFFAGKKQCSSYAAFYEEIYPRI